MGMKSIRVTGFDSPYVSRDDSHPVYRVGFWDKTGTSDENRLENAESVDDVPNRLGSSTTIDAIRYKRESREPTSGRMHVNEGEESMRGLTNWLGKNSGGYDDRLVAQSLAAELRGLLR